MSDLSSFKRSESPLLDNLNVDDEHQIPTCSTTYQEQQRSSSSCLVANSSTMPSSTSSMTIMINSKCLFNSTMSPMAATSPIIPSSLSISPSMMVTNTNQPEFNLNSPSNPTQTSPNMGRKMSKSSSLSMDRAAFLMIRIKRIFRKKKKSKCDGPAKTNGTKKTKPPMLRARTLPSIIIPLFAGSANSNRCPNNNNNYYNNQYLNNVGQECDYSINNDGGRSPDLLLSSKDGFSSNGVSPRHSVSSNSSNGSTISNTKVNSLSTKTDKKTGFQKLTRLLSNNSNGKVSNTINWKGTSGQQQQQHHHSNQSQAPLVIVKESHNISDSSCFFWNHHKNQNKLKRTGSVDSMLSHVGGSSNVDQSMTTTTATKNENDTNQSTSHKQSSSGSSWHTPNRLLKASPVFSTKSSTYYLGSEIPVPSSTVLLPPAPSSPGPITNHGSSFYGTRSGVHKIPGKRQMSIDINAMPVETLKKSDRKRWEKLSKFNFDQQALFSAVENENFERTQLVVQTTDVDLNSTNSDGFTPLDISLMLLNIPIIKYLQSCGAKESDAFSNRVAKRERHLCQLLNEAERCVHDLTNCSRQSSIGNGSLSSALLKEKERQLVFWERRHRLLQRLAKGFELFEPPPPPLSVHVEVKGATSLLVHYFPPIRLQEKRNIITKYKIDWSDNSFETVLGSVEINNLASKHEYVIENLESERCYQVRIASSNCKGYSEYCYPLMNQSIPSSWRSIDRKASTFSSSDRVMEIDDLFRQIINSKQVTENELKRLSIDTEAGAALPPSSLQSQKRVRKSIKNFFGAANKFQRVMKRGIFFASLIYHEHRVLVTNDEVLPIIEIDDIYPSTLQNDFYWLLKIACTWDDIKMFRRDMEKSQSSVAHFRTRILLAIEQMQSSLGLSDLGQLFYKPLRDSEGTVVLCTIRALSDPKQISCLSLRWLPLVKLHKRMYQQQQAAQSQQQAILQKESFSERVSDSGISLGGCEYSPRLIGNILVSTLNEMIEFHQACNTQLPRGLYVGYVKLRSSVDMMSVMVSKDHPNILPHAKIRDNPHISRTEWSALKYCLRPESVANAASGSSSSSLIHCNLSASASQLYLSTLQQQKEVIESKVDSGSTYGNYLNANSPTPSINQSDNQSVGMISPIHSNRANHLSQLFQLAINGQQSSNVSSLTNPITIQKLTFSEKLSFQQLLKFLQMLSQTAGHFLQSIGVTDGEHADAHRLYSLEVIELSSDVSLILLLPPVDEVCSMFNHSDSLNQVPNLIYLPLKIFELIHMNTYQPNFTGRYSRISAMLESDIMVAQQAQREAFSSAEVKTAKARVNQLQEFQTQLDEYCRSMRWIMDVVAFARDRQLAAGIPLFDVQYTLNCVDKQLLEEDNDDRLFHVPAISLSTPSDHPIINIQSECNSTPSSPPAISPSPSSMGRRKSRDDSFLEEHHRLQNRFNSVHHHRFHNQYGCSHQKNGTAFPFHCDSLESGCNDLDQLLPANMNPSVLVDTNATDNLPNMGSHYGLETMEGGCSSGASSETHDQNNEPPQAAKEDNEYSKSSFSLQTEHIVGFSQPRGSLMVDKSLLEDMRRCVSASKLIERTGSDDSPNSISTPPPSNHAGLIHRRMTSAANYFFTNDCDDIDTESINPPSDHHRPSVNSIDSFSEMSIGGSQISLISSSHNQSIDIDYCNVPMFSNSKPTEFGEIYRPLSRLLMLSNENLDQPPLFEEEEEEMPIPERLVKQQSIENENKMNESNVESINPINVQLDIPQLRIWSDSTESIPKKLEEEFLASETIDLNIPEPETELTSVESENSPNLIEVDSNLSFFNDNFIDLLSNYVQPESTSTEMLSKPIIPNQNKPSIKLNKMFYSGDSSISKKKNFEINLQQNDKRLNQLHYRNDDNVCSTCWCSCSISDSLSSESECNSDSDHHHHHHHQYFCRKLSNSCCHSPTAHVPNCDQRRHRSRFCCRRHSKSRSKSKRKQINLKTIHISYETNVVPIGTAIEIYVNQCTKVSDIIQTLVLYLQKLAERFEHHRHHHHHHHHHVQNQQSLNRHSQRRRSSCKPTLEDDEQKYLLKQKLKILKNSIESYQPEHENEPIELNPIDSKYRLSAIFDSNVKHLNPDFPILYLQSPWNEAKLLLEQKPINICDIHTDSIDDDERTNELTNEYKSLSKLIS